MTNEHQQIPPQGPYGNPYAAAPPQQPGYPQSPPPPGYPQSPPPGYGYPYPNAYPYPHQPFTAGPPPHLLANQGLRLVARLIDVVILVLAIFITSMTTAALVDATQSHPLAVILGASLSLGTFAFYEPVQNWKWGGTVGKRICNLRVARLADGQNLSFGQAVGRAWIVLPMGFVPFLGLANILWCTWDKPNQQCLHDKVVSSVVVTRG
ncbi:RDD family protein [Streptomyces sp. E11-3]|uniref:RDD family protein n=1 Tax=Streptomyces sp. E11-3 TaxID=3110112 RepID=UPI00397E9686